MRPKLERSPMKLLPVWEKVKLYPQKNHWKSTTAMDSMANIISESADLRRARPE